ncbi:MFS transporter [Roseiterribacter gracilis]|uniref:MFS transporter n=1 Tax=Roseiterribacter gracilis TaxID=2812848 RepID=A0A8S8XFI9_9PROT|nr:MFS transporter [Rhodospirillales bacterium TMPK1]
MAEQQISTGPVSAASPTQRPLLAVAAVLLGSFLTGFDTRFLSIGLPDLRGAFGLGFDEGAWLATITTSAQLIAAPAVAWLATAFGIRLVMIPACLIYAVTSQTIPFVRDVETLYVLHFIHGLMLGAFIPATLMIIFRHLPPKWWLPALAVYVFRSPFSLNFGVSLVGFYTQVVGWHALYGQHVALSLLMAALVWFGAARDPINRQLVRNADWAGMLFLGIGTAMIYAGLDQGNRLNWLESGTVMSLLAGGTVLMILFFINEAVVAEPWAHYSVLASHNVALGIAIILIYAVTSLSNSLLTPNFLINVAQLRPEQVGDLLLPYLVLPLIVAMFVGVWFLRHYDARILIAIGFTAFGLAAWLGTGLTQLWRGENFIPLALLQAVGHAFTFLGVLIFIISNADPKRATAFGAYVQVVRLDGIEIGTSLMATWVRVREQLHSNLLGQYVGAGDSDTVQALHQLTGGFARGSSAEVATARGVATLASRVTREANVLAYIDAFEVAFAAAVVGLLLVAMLRPAPIGPLSPKR